jgi:hypothetical protein
MTGGRPSALTPEVQKRILSGLRCGLSRAASASRAGIGARTFREWMARTDDVEPYASLRAEVEAAEGSCEARLAAVVFKAALEDPNQARWLLERRFPASWGRRQPEQEPAPAAAGPSLSKFFQPQPDLSSVPPWERSRLKPSEPTNEVPFWLRPEQTPPPE